MAVLPYTRTQPLPHKKGEKMPKNITGVDDDTELWVVNKEKEEAEKLDGFFVYHANRPKLKNKDFFFMFQSNALTKLALNDELRVTDYRLLLILFEYLDFENLISITQKQLEAVSKIGQAEISKSFKRLESQGILSKQKHGNRNMYKLNSSYAWKGKASAYLETEKRKKELDRAARKVVPIKRNASSEKTTAQE
jgi:hypothetical protein